MKKYFLYQKYPKTGFERGYYIAWHRSTHEPLMCENPRLGAKQFSKGDANRLSRKLSDGNYWGGEWETEPVPAGFNYIESFR